MGQRARAVVPKCAHVVMQCAREAVFTSAAEFEAYLAELAARQAAPRRELSTRAVYPCSDVAARTLRRRRGRGEWRADEAGGVPWQGHRRNVG